LGLAVNGSGDVIVADEVNQRIQIFAPQSVPEPSSLIMLGLGSLMAAGFGARRLAGSRRTLSPTLD
jgi:hypothetical protein